VFDRGVEEQHGDRRPLAVFVFDKAFADHPALPVFHFSRRDRRQLPRLPDELQQ